MLAGISHRGREEARIPTLSPLGESDFWIAMGSIGPQKSGRVDRTGVLFSRAG
jgi:hypothetical protein